MSIEEQIKPVDWAKEHGVKSDFVVKLLRDNGVKVLTQVSKVNASEFEKIEAAVADEEEAGSPHQEPEEEHIFRCGIFYRKEEVDDYVDDEGRRED